jgi:hypothetical protein
VNSLQHQYQENWVEIYETIAVDEKLKKVMLQIYDTTIAHDSTYRSQYFNV